jgi:hypothetical protein
MRISSLTAWYHWINATSRQSQINVACSTDGQQHWTAIHVRHSSSYNWLRKQVFLTGRPIVHLSDHPRLFTTGRQTRLLHVSFSLLCIVSRNRAAKITRPIVTLNDGAFMRGCPFLGSQHFKFFIEEVIPQILFFRTEIRISSLDIETIAPYICWPNFLGRLNLHAWA